MLSDHIDDILTPRTAYKHYHKFNLQTIKSDFEPYTSPNSAVQLFERVEYAHMYCFCGIAKKVRTETED